jgi:hypothetical protein
MSRQNESLLDRLHVYQETLEEASRRHRWIPARHRHAEVSREAELYRLGYFLAGCSREFLTELQETTNDVVDRFQQWTEGSAGLSLPARPALRLVEQHDAAC